MTARLVRKHLALVPRPCYSVQHLQNCCHETESRPSVNTYIHSLPCSTCELASQRESASGASSSFSGDACGSIHMLQTTIKAPYWLLSPRSTRIYPLQISCSGLGALDKNAGCPRSQTNVFCRIGRLYLQINPHVGTFGSQACLY